jgi:hypothetical protein
METTLAAEPASVTAATAGELADFDAVVRDHQPAIFRFLLEAANPDDAKVLPQIDRVAEARAELEKANARMLLGLRHVLTPEQWKALESEEHGPHGPEGHGGPGGQHMMPPPPPHPEHD